MENHIIVHLTGLAYPPASARHKQAGRMMIFYSRQFSPEGRIGGFHLPAMSGIFEPRY